MADASYVQSSFLGGEWSPYYQGRFDHPKYRSAMRLCRNALPIEEAANVRRPGTAFCATTRSGAPGRTISFDIEQVNPFQIEMTDGHVRMFAGNGLVFDSTETVLSINTATPAQITLANAVSWATGDQIQLLFQGAAKSSSGAILRNRQLALTKIDAQNFTLADPITGVAVNGSTVNWDPTQVALTAARVLDFATTYTSQAWKNVRRVQNEQTAILLHGQIAPNVLALPINGSTNQFAPFTYSTLNFVDGPYLDPVRGSQATPGGLSGIITLSIAWQTWSNTATYGLGDIVTQSGQDYQSLIAGNIGHSPASSPTDWKAINAGSAVGQSGFVASDTGRQVRLFSEPPAWSSTTVYGTVGMSVVYNGQYYTSIAAMQFANHVPSASPTKWALNPQAAAWTWGKITEVDGPANVKVQILGVPLLYSNTINTWRLGAYSNTTGWPTCGTFHEGRLWLGGAIPNRFDASMSNGDETLPGVTNTWQFAPTQQDGTVADNNAITYTFRAPDKNTILWMEPGGPGIIAGTIKAEWQIWSGNQEDPITPTSIHAKRITKYGCANIEPKHTGLTLVFVQAYKRKLLEFFPDVFTGKFTAPNLSEQAQHFVTNGTIEEISYQREKVPVVWARTSDGRLLGCTYKRETLMSSQPANFVGWHEHSLGSGRTVESISVGPTPDGTSDELMLVTNDPATGIRHVEAMTPIFDQGAPLTEAWYVDDAVTPSGMTSDGNGVTFYGLWHLNGKSVSIFIGGLYLGQFPITNGQITVPFGVVPLFTQAYLNSISGTGYGSFATSLDTTVTVKPPVPYTGASANGVVLGYIGSTLSMTDFTNSKAFADYARNKLYVQSNAGGVGTWRTFDLINGPELAESSLSTSGSSTSAAGFDGRYVYTTDNGNANFVYKLDATQNFITAATFGTAPDIFGDFGDQSGTLPQPNQFAAMNGVNGLTFLEAAGGINDSATVLNASTMSFAGHVFFFPNQGNRTGRYVVAGPTVNDGNGNYAGVSYIAWNKNNGAGGPTTAIYLYRTSVKSNLQLALGSGSGGFLGGLFGDVFGGGTPTVPYRLGADTYGQVQAWDPAIQYQVGDIVTSANNAGPFGNSYFMAVAPSKGVIPIVLPSFTSTQYKASFFWQPMGPTVAGPNPSPAGTTYLWDPAIQYQVDDVVVYNNVPTRSQGTSTGTNPAKGILSPKWVFVPNAYVTTQLIRSTGILPTDVDPTWTTIGYGGAVLDQVDNNLIMHVTTTDNVAQQFYVIKVNVADATVMWKTPVNAASQDQVTLAAGRLQTGVYAFFTNPSVGGLRNVYVLNSLTGAVNQVLTVTGVTPGQGQFFDNVGGLIYVIASYTQAAGTPSPYLLTPSLYTNKWTAFWPSTAGGNNVFQGSTTAQNRDTLPVVIGFNYLTQCQLLRPNEQREAGAVNGPAFGKKRRSHMYAMLLDGTGVDDGTRIGSDLQVGTDFAHLRPVDFRSEAEVQPAVNTLFSDIAWTTLDDNYSFDSCLCWQISRPYPCNVMAYGAFLHTEDR